ncbi:hypothetical protein SAMN06296386_101333 [Lachnospiraceae bacterium]|nr:hypothetical protein SAMN06296386_101333 [Lachnospiraceae bacterium]
MKTRHVRGIKMDIFEVLNKKQVYSRRSHSYVTFVDSFEGLEPGVYCDGTRVMDDDVEGDIYNMYCMMKDNSVMNMADFYMEYGDDLLNNVIEKIRDR